MIQETLSSSIRSASISKWVLLTKRKQKSNLKTQQATHGKTIVGYKGSVKSHNENYNETIGRDVGMIEIKIITSKETLTFAGTTINAYNKMLTMTFDCENTEDPVVLGQYRDGVLYERVTKNGEV